MTRTIEAIYSNGVLRPVQPLSDLCENGRVVLTITTPPAGHALDGWVGGLSDEDAQEMLRAVETEFEQFNSDEWK